MRSIIVQGSVIFSILLFNCSKQQTGTFILSAPAGSQFAKINPKGVSIIPNGRVLTPLGRLIRVAPHPYGLVKSPDGNVIVTSNSGTRPFSLSIIRDFLQSTPQVRQIPEPGASGEGLLETVFMGLAITSDSKQVFASTGGGGDIKTFDLHNGAPLATIPLNGDFADGHFADSYIGELALTKNDSLLYALDQANFRLAIVSVSKRRVIGNIAVGRYPFGIALSPDEETCYVANVGMFAYSFVKGFDGKRPDETTIHFPAFGFPSQEAEKGTVCEGIQVPGLGDANVPESFSVWVIDILHGKVIAKIKTGHLVGEQLQNFAAVGGSGPNSIVASADYVYVSNGNNDCITVIDAKSNTIIKEISLFLHPHLQNVRGVLPFGLCLSPDYKRLYVAESGINAVAVIDAKTFKVLGHLPVAWFPSKLTTSLDGKYLYVANAKGLGAGPNAGAAHQPEDPKNVGHLMRGYVSIFKIPRDSDLKRMTERVVSNNVVMTPARQSVRQKGHPIPVLLDAPGPIKHIVYITKENRTFDEVFGALQNVNGDSDLCIYGAPRTFTNEQAGQSKTDVVAMPNHIALARRFAICDNFYCDSDHSADGHRWLVDTYPNEWTETATSAHYGHGKRYQSANAVGRLGFTGASAAIYPEDYNEAGSIWEHFARHGISFWNYGLGFEFAGTYETQHSPYTGIQLSINYPIPKPLFERTCRYFATFNMNIPDQFRMDMFEQEFKQRWLSGKEAFPQVITMMLPNDHSASPRPEDGFPFRASYMADNDLALGRLVELLSSSPFWRDMAIFVTEDDAQGGLDHVDAHRSFCLVISPYCKKGTVSSVHTSIVSIMKSIFLILHLPPVNLYDACASDLSDCFVNEPVNLEPYHALAVDPALFDAKKALDPFDKGFNWKDLDKSPDLDDPAMLRFEREQKYEEWKKLRK